jgi:hypothetical protein
MNKVFVLTAIDYVWYYAQTDRSSLKLEHLPFYYWEDLVWDWDRYFERN